MKKRIAPSANTENLQQEDPRHISSEIWLKKGPKLTKGLARLYKGTEKHFLKESVKRIREALETRTYREREKELIREFKKAVEKSKLSKRDIFFYYLLPELEKLEKGWIERLKKIDETLLGIKQLATKTSLDRRDKAS